MDPLHICISENRRYDEIGLKLLVLSLTRHEPDAILHLFVDDLSDVLKAWLDPFENVRQEHLVIDPALGWNIKAKVFAKLFDDGLKEIIWLDSDIIVTGRIAQYFKDLPDTVLVTAEQYYTFHNQGVVVRTKGWGLPVGRDLPFTPNNCVMRVTQMHIPFLKAWQNLLDTQDYKRLQTAPWHERPFYMMGSQDVMSALLGSAEFAELEVRSIRRGRDIAQCFGPDGYGVWERLGNLRRVPPFVHAQGGKPWRLEAGSKTYQYVSPYWYAAHEYVAELSQIERGWLENRPKAAIVLDRITLGHHSMAGLPSALSFSLTKRLRSLSRALISRGRRA